MLWIVFNNILKYKQDFKFLFKPIRKVYIVIAVDFKKFY